MKQEDIRELRSRLEKMHTGERIELSAAEGDAMISVRHHIMQAGAGQVHEFAYTAGELEGGKWCPQCQKVKTKRQLGFEDRVYDTVGDEYTVVGEYLSMRKKVRMVHSNGSCNYLWDCDMRNFFYLNARCPRCAGRARFSKEEFLKALGEEFFLKSEYYSLNIDVFLEHNSPACGHYGWYIRPRSFLANPQCPECLRMKREKEYIALVEKLTGGEYSVLGSYFNRSTAVRMRHNSEKCGSHEWNVQPSNFIHNGSRCPKCAALKHRQKIGNQIVDG